jgi:hypothetical protein
MKSVSLLGSLLLSYHQASAQSPSANANLGGYTNVSDPYYGQSPPVYPTRKNPTDKIAEILLTFT